MTEKLKEIPFIDLLQELGSKRESDMDSEEIILTEDPLKATFKTANGKMFYKKSYDFKIENNIVTNANRDGKNPFFVSFSDNCDAYFTTAGIDFVRKEISKYSDFLIDDIRVNWDGEDCVFWGIYILINNRWYEIDTNGEVFELSDFDTCVRKLKKIKTHIKEE